MKRRISLWQKIFITGMIPVFIVSVLLSRSSFDRLKKTAYTLSENAIANQVKRIDLNLNTRMNLIESSLQSLADSISSNSTENGTLLESAVSPELNAQNMIAPFSEIRAAVISLDGERIPPTKAERLTRGRLPVYWKKSRRIPTNPFFHEEAARFLSAETAPRVFFYTKPSPRTEKP